MRHAIAIFACFATLFLCSCGPSPEDYQVAAPGDIETFDKGEVVVLGFHPDQDDEADSERRSYFAKSHAALREFVTTLITKPQSALQDMLARGDIVELTTPTQCKILEYRSPGYKIELTEGEHVGRTGWAWEAYISSQ